MLKPRCGNVAAAVAAAACVQLLPSFTRGQCRNPLPPAPPSPPATNLGLVVLLLPCLRQPQPSPACHAMTAAGRRCRHRSSMAAASAAAAAAECQGLAHQVSYESPPNRHDALLDASHVFNNHSLCEWIHNNVCRLVSTPPPLLHTHPRSRPQTPPSLPPPRPFNPLSCVNANTLCACNQHKYVCCHTLLKSKPCAARKAMLDAWQLNRRSHSSRGEGNRWKLKLRAS